MRFALQLGTVYFQDAISGNLRTTPDKRAAWTTTEHDVADTMAMDLILRLGVRSISIIVLPAETWS